MCRVAKKNVQDAVEMAKSRWASHLAMKISQMRPHPKEAWKAVKDLRAILTGHHSTTDVMRFKIPSGKLSKTPMEHASVLLPHFSKVYNNQKQVDPTALYEVRQRKINHDISGPLTYPDLDTALRSLSNHKEPGINGVTGEDKG